MEGAALSSQRYRIGVFEGGRNEELSIRARPHLEWGRADRKGSCAWDQRLAAGAAQGVGHQGDQHNANGEPKRMVATGTQFLVTHDVHLV
jgi:hypothetical protein